MRKDEFPIVHKLVKDSINEVLDKIKAEISGKYYNYDICEWYEDYDYEENDISEYQSVGCIADILEIINKYKAGEEITDDT